MLEREQDRFVGRGVAGMQRGDDIHRPHFGFGDFAFDEIHAGEAAFRGDLLGRGDQFGARFHRDHLAPPGRAEIKIVENKAQIGFARAQIGQHRLGLFLSGRRRSPALSAAPDAAPV